MKVFLYVGENDKTIHLLTKKRSYQLLCNEKKTINKNRIAKRADDVIVIAPEPRNKFRCPKCEKKVKNLMKQTSK